MPGTLGPQAGARLSRPAINGYLSTLSFTSRLIK
jgi:hypothetical protein